MKKSAILALARYRPWGLLIVLAFASHVSIAQYAFANKKSQRSISYSFEPVFSGDKMALRVTLEFIGGRSGEAELEVPFSYAGQQHLSKAFTELKVLSSQTTLRDASSASNKILNFPAGKTVRLSYLLIKGLERTFEFGHPVSSHP